METKVQKSYVSYGHGWKKYATNTLNLLFYAHFMNLVMDRILMS